MIGKIISLLLLALIFIGLAYVAIADVDIVQENRIVSMKAAQDVVNTTDTSPTIDNESID